MISCNRGNMKFSATIAHLIWLCTEGFAGDLIDFRDEIQDV